MDMQSKNSSPVLADPALANKSSLGTRSNLLPHPQSGISFSPGKHINIPGKKLDDLLSKGWLDAMKSSSPPRKERTNDFNFEVAADEIDTAYFSWTLEYPSALNSFDQIANLAKNKKIAVFLDYDGTLSPIVDDPDKAFMSDDMRAAVRSVAKYFPTAIITGRNRDKVYEFVGLAELYYAGSHGLDIIGPNNDSVSMNHPNCIKSTDQQGKDVNLLQPAREFLPMIAEVSRTLVENIKDIEGALVEDHKFCTSVHYRNVDEKNWPIIAQHVHDILTQYPLLRLTHGRKVLEIRPQIDWNKGKAVEFLLESLGLANRDDVLSIYIGDDQSDEDAFKVMREGNKGCGILVSSVPKETNASYSLRNPAEVMAFLSSLVKWKKLGGRSGSINNRWSI